MRAFLYILSFTILCSCAKPVNFHIKQFPVVDEIEKAEFWISPGKTEGKNLVFIFPDNLDSIHWNENSLLKELKNKNYKIVIPQLTGKEGSHQNLLDSRTRRINSVRYLLNKLISTKEIDSAAKIVLIGFGEGAYIIPYLAQHLPRVEQFFMVNSALGSPLEEFQLLISEGNNSFLASTKMRYFGMDDIEELKKTISEVLTYSKFDIRLGNKTNYYWNDFYSNPTDADLVITKSEGHILLSEAYPFISSNTRAKLKVIQESSLISPFQIKELKGKGDFRKKGEIAELENYILKELD